METSPDRVVDRFTELLDIVDSKEIANEHRVGIHSNRIDFEEYAKIGAFLARLGKIVQFNQSYTI